jgi:hypothetical protein
MQPVPNSKVPHSTPSPITSSHTGYRQGTSTRRTNPTSSRSRARRQSKSPKTPTINHRSPYQLRKRRSEPRYPREQTGTSSPTLSQSSASSTRSTNILPPSLIKKKPPSGLAIKSESGMSSPGAPSEEHQKRAALHPTVSPTTQTTSMGIPAFTTSEFNFFPLFLFIILLV